MSMCTFRTESQLCRFVVGGRKVAIANSVGVEICTDIGVWRGEWQSLCKHRRQNLMTHLHRVGKHPFSVAITFTDLLGPKREEKEGGKRKKKKRAGRTEWEKTRNGQKRISQWKENQSRSASAHIIIGNSQTDRLVHPHRTRVPLTLNTRQTPS